VSDEPTGLPVDWDLAVRTAHRLLPAGPSASPHRAAAEVVRLRSDATAAEGHVRALTGLGEGLPVPPADVVDRPGWVRAAADGMALLTNGARVPQPPSALARRVTTSTSGMQAGAVLAYLGSRVLGQYDPFGGPDRDGRLLLVAPNVFAAQRALGVPAEDFGLSACLRGSGPTCKLKPVATEWTAFVNRAMNIGQCEGMAVSSLAFYQRSYNPEFFARRARSAHDLTHAEVAPLIGYFWAYQMVDPVHRDKVASLESMTPISAEETLVDMMKRKELAVIAIRSPHGGHAVTPLALALWATRNVGSGGAGTVQGSVPAAQAGAAGAAAAAIPAPSAPLALPASDGTGGTP